MKSEEFPIVPIRLPRAVLAGSLVLSASLLPACTVAVRAPTEPITINLNVKIDQEVRVRLDDDVEELIAENPDLF